MASEFSINRAAAAIRRSWPIVVVAVVTSVVIASIYLHTAQYKYVASYQVTPTQSSSMTGGLGSQFSGLAAAAGLTLPTSPSETNFQLYLKGLHSREVATALARDEGLVRSIFDAEWDPASGKWHAPRDRLSFIKEPIKALLGVPTYRWERPGAARMQEFLEKSVKIEQSAKDPVAVVSFAHPDPAFAVRLLEEADRATDGQLRRRALIRSTDYIRHLTAKLSTVSVAELRTAIAQALSEQEKVRMTASSSLPFAAELFSKPSASRRPILPDPRLVLISAFFIGIFGGVSIALIRDAIRQSAPRRESA